MNRLDTQQRARILGCLVLLFCYAKDAKDKNVPADMKGDAWTIETNMLRV